MQSYSAYLVIKTLLIQEPTRCINPMVNNVMNEGFLKRVEFEEVKVVIFFLVAYKTFGRDGFPLAFFQGL